MVLFMAYESDRLEDMRLQAENPRGQNFESTCHGSGAKGPDSALLATIQAEMEFERANAKLEARLDAALDVLYGRDGHGGLAKLRSSADADCICGYFLMGMSWPEVASEMVRPDSKDGAQWCKRRAYRALEFIDKYGAQKLSDS